MVTPPWRQLPPSPFFEETDFEYENVGHAYKNGWLEEKVEEQEDSEDYYNEWIMSQVAMFHSVNNQITKIVDIKI